MSRRKQPVEGQLALKLPQAVPPAVEHVRSLRREAGLPESLTAPEVLTQVLAILDTDAHARTPRSARLRWEGSPADRSGSSADLDVAGASA